MKASVIVRTFNSASTLRKCLASIRASSFKDYELIVVDDASQDDSVTIARQYTDKILHHEKNQGRKRTRITGLKAATGDIIIFIDSDIEILSDSLQIIANYFSHHPNVSAVTGLLSKNHPNHNFFSQYKNLYMHFIFHKLPGKIYFLYGSIFGLNREAVSIILSGLETIDDTAFGEDTALGQLLSSKGKEISFLKNLEVVHYKHYSFFSWIKNDFTVPYWWTTTFFKFKGWKQLGKNGVGYAHSPTEQLISVMIAPIILLSAILSRWIHPIGFMGFFLLISWFFLNHKFLLFLKKERGFPFFLKSIGITFLDHCIMASAIVVGFTKNIPRL